MSRSKPLPFGGASRSPRVMIEAPGARVASLAWELSPQPISVLLASAAARRVTGTFSFRHAAGHDELTMRAGAIAVVRTSRPVAFLGGILYERAIIDSAALNETLLEVANTRRLHGAVLEERGLVTREQLESALSEETLRTVCHLFSLPDDVRWTFDADRDELSGARDEDRPAVDPWRAIWRGLREHPPMLHVARVVKALERGIHVRDAAALDRLGLTGEERALCDCLVQPITISRLVASSPFSADRTLLLVYFLALGRCVMHVQVDPVSPLELGASGVRERARAIGQEDPYTVLGLVAGAPAEAARAAYFRLAKLWHADRRPPALDEVRAECDHVLLHLGRAHRVLTGARYSGQYPMATRATCGAGRPASPPATMRDVDDALARNDLEGAAAVASILSSAGMDGPAARAVVVWCQARAGRAPRDVLDSALIALKRIIAGDPECTRALFYRGEILKCLGRTESAMRDFRKVTRLDRRHVEAQREVRLHDIRGRSCPGGDRAGEGAPARRSSSAALRRVLPSDPPRSERHSSR